MKLIDKDALVAEIENHINRCNIKKQSCPVNTQVEAICDNKICAYKELLSFLDTLEVKEVGEKSVSEDLEEAAKNHAVERYRATRDMVLAEKCKWSFKAGAEWQKENLWKPADGDDLPEIDREVIVLIKYNAQRNIHDGEYPTYRVGFGHRPNPDGWDGKDIDTNEVTHYTPKLYDKGGWNAPNIVYWLDAKLPYEENKIIK